MSWGDAFPIALATIACFFLPGMVIALLAGVRGLGVAALAPALSLGIAGVGAVVLSVLGLRWSLASYLGFATAVALALSILVSRKAAGRFFAAEPEARALSIRGSRGVLAARSSRALPSILAPVGGVVAAGLISLGPLQEGMGRVDLPALTWDSIHHHSAIRYITDLGDGSSLNLGGVASNNDAARFYPGAWHDLVSLTVGSFPISASINVAALTMACLIWPLSVAYLARIAFPTLVWMPLLAPIVATGFVAFPARMISYGTIWPAAMGTAIVPALIALVLVITAPGTRPSARFRLALLLLVGLAGATLCHPTATVAVAYLCLPFIVVRYYGVLRQCLRRRRRLTAGALIAVPLFVSALAAVVVMTVPAVRTVFFFRTTPVGPATDAVGAAIFDTMLAPLGHGNTEPFWLGGVLAIAGLITTLVSREYRWISAGWIITVVLYVVAAGEETMLRPLVGLWYSDPVRVGGLVPLFTSLLASYAVLKAIVVLLGWIPFPSRVKEEMVVASSLVVLIGVMAAVYPMTDELRADEKSGRLAADYWEHLEWDGGIASLDELEFIERLAEELPDDAVVLGDPTSGAALVYSLAGKDTVFRTMAGTWEDDAKYLARNFNHIDSDPRVCQLIERFGVTHFYDDDHRYLPDIIHRKDMGGLTAAGVDPADLDLVDSSGDGAKIFAIEACGQ
ncbi:hypothetical protein FJV46_04715 [Arthrobacter agilis]|uniref:DUF6541 family protein n=1 Tax=Arthrobacter agilis TaxID=37921 RepID=UPI000B35D325|nr:DUF6541 family protein [Arthrobacter agilis]OUM41315.1 hypothetical protein B8W74_10330 [Arthrobacter agilis]PPB46354.1 hypothetical protein CI784_08565 [Arthrobacter agilis]TPV27110.1 hypothetical protein FJV46_04715 [Arthrobacter agilis]VDR32721.1 Uncharacterised protein [Arthrobacter agilis]